MPSATTAVPPIDRRQFLKLVAGSGAVVAGSLLLPAVSQGKVAIPRVEANLATTSESISELAATLDNDVERIFRFVSEEIRYEPYVGILRGANGALLGRAGNSADQALLLAELLTASGLAYRFAFGAIDDATAGAILDAAVVDTETARDEAYRVLVADAQPSARAARSSAAPDPDLDAIVAAAEADVSTIAAAAARQLQDGVDTIAAALADAGISLPDATTTLPDHERTQHVWIQVASGTDWVDLDPTLPTTQLGESLTSATTTTDTLADDLRHRLDFVAIGEHWVDAQLTQAPTFEYSVYADAVQGVPIAFTNVRTDDLGINIIAGVGGGSAHYTSVLEIGPKVFVGTTGLSLGAPGDGFFGEPTGGEAAGLLEGEASAQWLEVRVTSPGADPVVARRTIFDRIGRPMRESGTVDPSAIAPVQLIDSGEAFGEYPPLMTLHAFSVVGGPLNGLTMLEPIKQRRLGVHSWAALAYHYLRDGLASEIGLAQGVRMVVDRPGVVSLTLDFTPGVAPDTTLSLDIWHRGFATLPISDTAATAHPAIIAGVLSHVAERVATSDVVVDGTATPGGPVSVGAIFDLAHAQRVPVRVLKGSVPAGSSYPAEASTLIAAALDAGLLVVVPEQPIEMAGRPRLGWWLVDPKTGQTTDQLDNGRGQGNVEYNATGMAQWVRDLKCVGLIGGSLTGSTLVVAWALGGEAEMPVLAVGTLAAKVAIMTVCLV